MLSQTFLVAPGPQGCVERRHQPGELPVDRARHREPAADLQADEAVQRAAHEPGRVDGVVLPVIP